MKLHIFLFSLLMSCSGVLSLSAATNLVFIHHSVGADWLDQGELDQRLTELGLSVNDTDYGDDVPGTPHPECNPIGDYTDICHWYYWFNYHMPGILAWECGAGSSNQIIMFKSCYPNSAVYEEGTPPGNPTNENRTTWNNKAAYLSLTNVFYQHCSVLFIAVTAPPMKPGHGYNPDDAGRGRAFNDWLNTEYINGYHAGTGLRNLAVFDLFDVLTTPSTKPRGANALYPKYRTRDSHPNARGGRAATAAFLPWLRDAMHYWQTGVMRTNTMLKQSTAKLKESSGMLKVKAYVNSFGGTPGTVTVYAGNTPLQVFDAATFSSRGVAHVSKTTDATGRKVLLKLLDKREPKLMMKIWLTAPASSRLPLRIDFGNGQTSQIDLLFNEKGKFP
jgi:hypothetical protein